MDETGDPGRYTDPTGRWQAHPLAENGNGFLEAVALWSDHLEGDFGRRIWANEERHGIDQLIEMHDLQRRGLRHHRQDRPRGKATQHRAAAKGSAADDHGWTQDHPVEIERHEGFVAA